MREISTDSDPEVRIAALEKRIRDLEAHVGGLTAELIDLKKVTAGASRQDMQHSHQYLKKGTVVRGTVSPELAGMPESPSPAAPPADDRIVIRPKGAGKKEEPKDTEEPMVRIMQPDGTFKMERRRGDRKMS